MTDRNLRRHLVCLAHEKPELRHKILPLLRQGASERDLPRPFVQWAKSQGPNAPLFIAAGLSGYGLDAPRGPEAKRLEKAIDDFYEVSSNASEQVSEQIEKELSNLVIEDLEFEDEGDLDEGYVRAETNTWDPADAVEVNVRYTMSGPREMYANAMVYVELDERRLFQALMEDFKNEKIPLNRDGLAYLKKGFPGNIQHFLEDVPADIEGSLDYADVTISNEEDLVEWYRDQVYISYDEDLDPYDEPDKPYPPELDTTQFKSLDKEGPLLYRAQFTVS